MSTFEIAFLAKLGTLLNDASIILTWGRAPEGAPVVGRKEVVLFYAPGGERQLTHSGMSTEQGRRIQVSIFSHEVQDVKNAAQAIHTALDGWSGTLADGTAIYAVVPGIQDIDSFDNEEKVFQTVLDYMIRMSENDFVMDLSPLGEFIVDGGTF